MKKESYKTIAIAAAALCLIILPPDATAQGNSQARQVGPQTFHQRIEIPNAVGRNTLNNPDTFIGQQNNRNMTRAERRGKRDNRRNNKTAATNNEDARTQSEHATNAARKGRRERQNQPSRTHKRIMQKHLQGTTNNQGVNN